jgi:2'-5' RNA ligase
LDPGALEAAPALIRAFVGIPVPDEHRAALEPFLRQCAADHPEFRWVPAANLHLTLRFLGNAEPERLDRLGAALEAIRSRHFELALDDVGAFGSGRHKRVLWLGVSAGVAAAEALAADVERACVEAGFEAEERPFRAHVTLARARDRRGAPEPKLGPFPTLASWTASEFVLFHSKPGPRGSEYVPLRTFALDRL